MKFFGVIVLLLGVVAYSSGANEENTQRAIHSGLANLAEQVREILRTGHEDLGIPVCEPLEVDQYDFNVDENWATLTGSLSNLNVTGLSDFEIDSLTFSVIGIKFTFSFTWPVIYYDTDYTIDGVAGSIVPVYGTGKISGDLKNLRVSGTGQISVRDSYLYVRSLKTAYSLEALNFQITGILNDNDDMSALVSAVVSDVTPQLIDDYQTEISTFVDKKLIEVANKYLGTMTLAELLALIQGK